MEEGRVLLDREMALLRQGLRTQLADLVTIEKDFH